jgi:hypothetical protein
MKARFGARAARSTVSRRIRTDRLPPSAFGRPATTRPITDRRSSPSDRGVAPRATGAAREPFQRSTSITCPRQDAPLENQRAVGWFDIDVRDGELWAVNVEWTDVPCVAGSQPDPPEWRYHSPAYDIDSTTGRSPLPDESCSHEQPGHVVGNCPRHARGFNRNPPA